MQALGTFVVALVVVTSVASAQTSSSYKLTEHSLNAGGRPEHGTVAASASYRITLDSIGDAIVAGSLSSASFHTVASFGQAYPPPEEVRDLRWATATDLEWNAERSVGGYNLYRDGLTDLPGTHGECLASDLGGTSYIDTTDPPAGDGYFYLVTARNRLHEEGNRGTRSDGTPRSSLNACP